MVWLYVFDWLCRDCWRADERFYVEANPWQLDDEESIESIESEESEEKTQEITLQERFHSLPTVVQQKIKKQVGSCDHCEIYGENNDFDEDMKIHCTYCYRKHYELCADCCEDPNVDEDNDMSVWMCKGCKAWELRMTDHFRQRALRFGYDETDDESE